MDRHKIGTVLAVWVGHHPSQLWNDLWRPVGIRPEVHPTLVVVIGMLVVPDHRGPLERNGDLFQGGDGDVLGDYLIPSPHHVDVRG